MKVQDMKICGMYPRVLKGKCTALNVYVRKERSQ